MKEKLEQARRLLREHPGDVPEAVADQVEDILDECLERINP